MDDQELADRFGGVLVSMCHDVYPQIRQQVDGQDRVIKLNLLSYCIFCLGWQLADKVDGPYLDIFIARVVDSAKRNSEYATLESFEYVIRDRGVGFIESVKDSSGVRVAEYFEACCSVDSRSVLYDSIRPHIEDLEFMGSKLTEKGRKLIDYLRKNPDTPMYRMDANRSHKLCTELMSIMKRVKGLIG